MNAEHPENERLKKRHLNRKYNVKRSGRKGKADPNQKNIKVK